uniref:Uncharacterized protein n=1 Tax=Oryza glumipatula TaxID=40148 RepID=A0A0D9ZNW1_9ORYZ
MSVAWLGPPLPHGSHMSVRFPGCLGCCFTRSGSEALPHKYPSGGGDGGRRRRGGGGEVAVVGGGERGAGGGGRGVVPAGQGRRGVRDAVQGVRHRHPLRRRRRHRRHRRSSRGGRRIGGRDEGRGREHPEVDGSSSTTPSGGRRRPMTSTTLVRVQLYR